MRLVEINTLETPIASQAILHNGNHLLGAAGISRGRSHHAATGNPNDKLLYFNGLAKGSMMTFSAWLLAAWPNVS